MKHDRISLPSLAYLVALTLPPPTNRADEAPPTNAQINDCGVNCIYLLLKLCHRDVDLKTLRRSLPSPTQSGLSMADLQGAAAKHGLSLRGVQLRPAEFPLNRPAIVLLYHNSSGHFVVLDPVGQTGTMVRVLDFPKPPRTVDYQVLLNSTTWTGIALVPVWPHEQGAPILAAAAAIATILVIKRRSLLAWRHRVINRITKPPRKTV